MTKKIFNSQWEVMDRPKSSTRASIKPISECQGIDWVLSHDGAFGIGFSVRENQKPKVNRNYKKIKFIESEIVKGQSYFCFLCDDEMLRELFEQLILDLLNFCLEHIEPTKFPQAIVNRAHAWEELFSKKRGGLSKNEAIGLMAEIKFLEDIWIAKNHSLDTWIGPSGAAQDFLDDDAVVEIKVKTPSNTVSINSIEQLNRGLGMYLVAYNAILDDEGESINDCVARLCNKLGPKSKDFMDLVTEAGFVKEQNFKSSILIENGVAYFVDENFPMLQPDDIPGLITAKYAIDLSILQSSMITLEDLNERL